MRIMTIHNTMHFCEWIVQNKIHVTCLVCWRRDCNSYL